MSANKFKVGDKVRVRKDLKVGKHYGGKIFCYPMLQMCGELLVIETIYVNGCYTAEECDFFWTDEMLEPAEKTLDNLCVGDFVGRSGRIRKVLVAIEGCYLLSSTEKYTTADEWYTASELVEYGFKPIDIEKTIEIDGKKYKKTDVEEATKDLEVVD